MLRLHEDASYFLESGEPMKKALHVGSTIELTELYGLKICPSLTASLVAFIAHSSKTQACCIETHT